MGHPGKKDNLKHLKNTSPEDHCVKGKDDVAIICSEDCLSAAENLKQFLDSDDKAACVILCKDRDMFSGGDLLTEKYSCFYVFVDSTFLSIVMNKQRLHDNVDRFTESVETYNRRILVLDMLPEREDRDRFSEFYYQLPRQCRQKFDDKSVTGRYSEDAMLHRSRAGDDLSTNNQNEEDEQNQSDNENKCSGLQVGSHLKMVINASTKDGIVARQEGSNSTMNINIDSSAENIKLQIRVTVQAKDKNVEEALYSDVKEDKTLEIEVKQMGGTNVVVRRGSVVIELDVDKGQPVDSDWIFHLLKLLFEDRLVRFLPEGGGVQITVQITCDYMAVSRTALDDNGLNNSDNNHIITDDLEIKTSKSLTSVFQGHQKKSPGRMDQQKEKLCTQMS